MVDNQLLGVDVDTLVSLNLSGEINLEDEIVVIVSESWLVV